jgi:hypothetical protein
MRAARVPSRQGRFTEPPRAIEVNRPYLLLMTTVCLDRSSHFFSVKSNQVGAHKAIVGQARRMPFSIVGSRTRLPYNPSAVSVSSAVKRGNFTRFFVTRGPIPFCMN